MLRGWVLSVLSLSIWELKKIILYGSVNLSVYKPEGFSLIAQNRWTEFQNLNTNNLNLMQHRAHYHLVLYKTAYVVCCLLFVVAIFSPLSSPKPNKARQCHFAHRPKMNYSRPSANFYFEIFRKSPLFSPKCVK